MPENIKQAAETFVKTYSEAIEAKKNFYEAAKGKKKIFDLPEWEVKKKAVDKRDAFANLTKTLTERENVPLTDIFTTAGESTHKGILFKFDGKYAYKNPLAKGGPPEKNHPLV